MSKTFTFAGTCVVNNTVVYKFANDANRAAVLSKLGATDVNMIELPKAMDKDAAVAYLAQVGITATKAPRAAKAAKVAKPAKVTKETTVAKVAKRVGDKPRKGQTPEAFALEWFASKEAKVAEKRAKGLLP
jgi:hypothetical protein